MNDSWGDKYLIKGKIYELQTSTSTTEIWGYDFDISSWQCLEGKSVDEEYKWYTYSGNTLTISHFVGPVNFEFKLKINAGGTASSLEKDSKIFKLKAVQSSVDYDFFITNTTINNSISSGTIEIKVQKRGETIEILDQKGQEKGLAVYDVTDNIQGVEIKDWASGLKDDTKTSFINLELRKDDIVWDVETIEFVHDGYGDPAKDFTVTADSYAIKKDVNGKYSSATLTAHLMNLSGSTVKWYQVNAANDTPITNGISSDGRTCQVQSPGAYKATYGKDWSDSVTIIEIEDGSDAISVVLTNPNMVFHAQTNNERESTAVAVYEGGTPLKYNNTLKNGTFKITLPSPVPDGISLDTTTGIIKVDD
jgi:hypothetical protein